MFNFLYYLLYFFLKTYRLSTIQNCQYVHFNLRSISLWSRAERYIHNHYVHNHMAIL